jgi:Bacterial regulatory proteins, tetR family
MTIVKGAPTAAASVAVAMPRQKKEAQPKQAKESDELMARRQAILSAAAAVFFERGFEAATTLEIANRAHTSKRALYELFGSKELLLAALIRASSQQMQGPLELAAPDSREALIETHSNAVKVLLHFDGADGSTTITDNNSGGAAHAWTANGNAQIDTAQSKLGGASCLFDGTGDYPALSRNVHVSPISRRITTQVVWSSRLSPTGPRDRYRGLGRELTTAEAHFKRGDTMVRKADISSLAGLGKSLPGEWPKFRKLLLRFHHDEETASQESLLMKQNHPWRQNRHLAIELGRS